MIFGIGTDIVHIERMRENLEKYGDKFAQRILTNTELDEFLEKNNKAAFSKTFCSERSHRKSNGNGV